MTIGILPVVFHLMQRRKEKGMDEGWYYDFIIPVIVTILTVVVIHVLLPL